MTNQGEAAIRKKIDREQLLEEVVRIGELLGETPTPDDLETYGCFSLTAYRDRFGSWIGALEEAGLNPGNIEGPYISDDELVEEFERLGRELGRTPTQKDVDAKGRFSITTYERRFDSWGDMVDLSVLDPWEREEGERQYYGPNWKQQRKRALERDGHTCQDCGMTESTSRERHGRGLHVHHITPARKFDDYEEQNALENLVVFCPSCHPKWEGLNLRPQS